MTLNLIKEFCKKTFLCSLFLSFPLTLKALEISPWFYPPWEFHVGAEVKGNFFPNVNRGFNPIDYSSNNILAGAYVLVPFSDNWEVEAELQFERTSKTPFDFQSVALQVRNQILNDVASDWVSFSVGLNARYVPDKWLVDVAIPYHNLANFELNASLGKEFTSNFRWVYRTFVYFAVGQANRGYPWLRGSIDLCRKVHNKSIFTLFSRGYFGLGNQEGVNVDNFKSYARIKHQSVDVGLEYTYLFDIWGSLTLEYAYRVYARSFPERVNFFKVAYDIPFGF